jgi:3-hydroxypropanoate dehydrogenase
MDDAKDGVQAAAAEAKERMKKLGPDSLDLLFREARTYRGWLDREVGDDLLHQLFDIMKLGPTSANCCPARIVFVKSAEAKARLKPTLAAGNVDKTMSAPVCAILGHDLAFHEDMSWLAPHMKSNPFAGNADLAESTAFRNGSLQGAYFIIAARALSLDCGPMSGFDNGAVDQAFFAGTAIRSNFLCNLGYGDRAQLHPRAPRHAFDQACQIL